MEKVQLDSRPGRTVGRVGAHPQESEQSGVVLGVLLSDPARGRHEGQRPQRRDVQGVQAVLDVAGGDGSAEPPRHGLVQPGLRQLRVLGGQLAQCLPCSQTLSFDCLTVCGPDEALVSECNCRLEAFASLDGRVRCLHPRLALLSVPPPQFSIQHHLWVIHVAGGPQSWQRRCRYYSILGRLWNGLRCVSATLFLQWVASSQKAPRGRATDEDVARRRGGSHRSGRTEQKPQNSQCCKLLGL
mmetsp:Transcript_17728/g.62114  ORF Transcript_17728/g.62114 Transcript_17728/m.62114 type:complete len:242 (-) Transcript_17728:606-1331(-)